ncbi:MAG: SRPBCC domain-containing protein [Microbacteriaceae bacterium]
MSDRTISHVAFELERVYPATPERVFAAFAAVSAKAGWLTFPNDWQLTEHTLDFRVGGHERIHTGPAQGPQHGYEAVYHDIVVNSRIVLSYEVRIDETLLSVSLATIELWPEGDRTHLILHDSGVFLDGHEDPRWREQGANDALDALGTLLDNPAVGA